MSNALWYNNWDYWNLFHKVTFDGPNKLILIGYGITDIDVQVDIYSDWKEWSRLRDNLKFEAALRTVGGDPTVGGSFLGRTFFLINGWRIRSWEGDHELNVDGNLFVDGGGALFVNTLRPWTVQTSVLRSNLVDVVVVSGSSQVVSGAFTEADRIILERIDSVTQNLPNSGSLTDIQTSLNTISSSVIAGNAATVMAEGNVISGSTNQVTTTIAQQDGLFDNMHVAVTNDTGAKVVRKVDTYLSSSGTFAFDVDLSFTPQSGSTITVLSSYDPRNGQVG